MLRTAKAAAGAAIAAALIVGLTNDRAYAMDCGAMLDQHSTAINGMANMGPERRAALRRMALSGYDHCMAGDTASARKFWEMVMVSGGSK